MAAALHAGRGGTEAAMLHAGGGGTTAALLWAEGGRRRRCTRVDGERRRQAGLRSSASTGRDGGTGWGGWE
jgi:hypothetical protein